MAPEPDYCEIGPGVFTDVYDWHVRYQQAIEVSRVDNRTAIRFMFTWIILSPSRRSSTWASPSTAGDSGRVHLRLMIGD